MSNKSEHKNHSLILKISLEEKKNVKHLNIQANYKYYKKISIN
jgi:hypothetical protein